MPVAANGDTGGAATTGAATTTGATGDAIAAGATGAVAGLVVDDPEQAILASNPTSRTFDFMAANYATSHSIASAYHSLAMTFIAATTATAATAN